MIKSWLNGSASDSISLADRGILYGDGFFTTISVLNAKPLLWQQHLARIQESSKRLSLTIDIEQLQTYLTSFLSEDDIPHRSILKILVTRGESGRGYHWGENSQANIIFQLFEYNYYEKLLQLREKGLSLKLCETYLSQNKRLAGLKHLNRLEQVLAASEFDKSKIDEGLMQDSDAWVIEGTKSNIFILLKDKLITPTLDLAGVKGVMRAFILENFSSPTFQLEEGAFKLEQVKQADAIFMSNALWGLCPVSKIIDSDWQADQQKVKQVLASININETCF